jgi:hypothetical protein
LLLRLSIGEALLKGCQLVIGEFVQLPVCEVAIDLAKLAALVAASVGA